MEVGSDTETMGGGLLTSFVAQDVFSDLSYHIPDYQPRVISIYKGMSPRHQQLFKKMHYDLHWYSQIFCRQFLNQGSLLSDNYSLYQAEIIPTGTHSTAITS